MSNQSQREQSKKSIKHAGDIEWIPWKSSLLPHRTPDERSGVKWIVHPEWAAEVEAMAHDAGLDRQLWMVICVGMETSRRDYYEVESIDLYNRILQHAQDLLASITQAGFPQVDLDTTILCSKATIDDQDAPFVGRRNIQSSITTLIQQLVTLREMMMELPGGTAGAKRLQHWACGALKRARTLAGRIARNRRERCDGLRRLHFAVLRITATIGHFAKVRKMPKKKVIDGLIDGFINGPG